MNDKAKKALLSIIQDHADHDPLNNANLCLAMLKDMCPRLKLEVNLLHLAHKEGIPDALQRQTNPTLHSFNEDRLTRQLVDGWMIEEESARWAVESWALALGLGEAPSPESASAERFTNSLGMEFVQIPAGSFMMGSPENEPGRQEDEGPQHRVTISKPFYLQTTPVTQRQWQQLMGNTPWKGDGQYQWHLREIFNSNPEELRVKQNCSDCPAVYICWQDAIAFVKRLNELETDVHYSLPSEAQWEYAARSGSTARWCFGDDENQLGEYAWFDGNTWSVDEPYAHPVANNTPNAWGIFDMHGNVWEWCNDRYSQEFYSESPEEDPQGVDSGDNRVIRGGSFRDLAYNTRSADRDRLWQNDIGYDVGFRIIAAKIKEEIKERNKAYPSPKPPGAQEVPNDGPTEGHDNSAPAELFTNSIGMEFVLIPAGSFMMGSPASEEKRDSDETQHKVTISKPFYLQTTEVTQGQWQAVMGSNPSDFKGENNPVEQVSWDDAQEFIKRLNQKEDTDKYCLPTEAQWEYACRAETKTPFSFGATISTDQANYDGRFTYGGGRKGVYREKTTAVKSFPANAFGLFDMHGNVREWCADWYGDYPSGPVTDPKGAPIASVRVIRGGSWGDFPNFLRSADRGRYFPDFRTDIIGFRVAKDY